MQNNNEPVFNWTKERILRMIGFVLILISGAALYYLLTARPFAPENHLGTPAICAYLMSFIAPALLSLVFMDPTESRLKAHRMKVSDYYQQLRKNDPVQVHTATIERPVLLYNPAGLFLGTILDSTMLDDVRLQIKQQKLSGYHIIGVSPESAQVRMDITPHGGITPCPEWLMGQHEKILDKLLELDTPEER